MFIQRGKSPSPRFMVRKGVLSCVQSKGKNFRGCYWCKIESCELGLWVFSFALCCVYTKYTQRIDTKPIQQEGG